MKASWLSSSTLSNKSGGMLFQKIFMVAIIVALMVALVLASSALAAPADNRDTYGDLEEEWSNKLRNWQGESLFYSQIRVFPADFEDLSDLARAHELLNKYAFALRQANTIITTRAGFDEKGNVVDERQADQSIRDLAENLHIMRGIREKLEEEGHTVRRFR